MLRGPSPLARGSLEQASGTFTYWGSIPARAGQPSSPIVIGEIGRVHPRSRGAAATNAGFVGGALGPSPLARGSPTDLPMRSGGLGSIPARAGQPCRRCGASRPRWVHPRSRGAAATPGVVPVTVHGPSPLARGSPVTYAAGVRTTGSIPARAGQPGSQLRPCRRRWVHPRSRGAARRADRAQIEDKGPSPLARGSQVGAHGEHFRFGSIPARAGQPTPNHRQAGRRRVHPRSRGAADRRHHSAPAGGGPSPLARGSRLAHHELAPHVGSIPARAGQPDPAHWLESWTRVHPRSRGAAGSQRANVFRHEGPSPLARGSPRRTSRSQMQKGSIPARAGQPPTTVGRASGKGVHPRSRGAAKTNSPPLPPIRGPSPLARGSP